jgi:hypothetical protein
MSLSQKSASDKNQKDTYVKDMNSALVGRIIQIRQEIVDLLTILDHMETRVSKDNVYWETK